MTRNELGILQQIGRRWFCKLMEDKTTSDPKFADQVAKYYFAIAILKDYDDALKELEKGIPEDH